MQILKFKIIYNLKEISNFTTVKKKLNVSYKKTIWWADKLNIILILKYKLFKCKIWLA